MHQDTAQYIQRQYSTGGPQKHLSCKRHLVMQKNPSKNHSFFVNNSRVLRESDNPEAHATKGLQKQIIPPADSLTSTHRLRKKTCLHTLKGKKKKKMPGHMA